MVFSRRDSKLNAFVGFVFLLGLSLQIVSPAVWASKARMQSLGQSVNGSLFIDDYRNIFLNPAQINNLEPQLGIEWGETAISGSPKAEGGIINTLGAGKLGIHVGRVGIAEQMFQTVGSAISGITMTYAPQNSLEVIYGSSVSTKWGGSVHYANSSIKTGETANYPDSEGSVISARGGVLLGNLTGYGAMDLVQRLRTDTSASAKNEISGTTNLEAGGTYELNSSSRLGLTLLTRGYSFDNGAGSNGTVDFKRLGFAYFSTIPTRANYLLFWSAGLQYSNIVYDFEATGLANQEQKVTAIPLNLGVEAPVTTWLVLRGSIGQNVLIDEVDTKNGATNNVQQGIDDTVVRAGAGIRFEAFQLDATFGGADDGSGDFNGIKFMANTSMSYKF